jgi:hypothetical protein
MKYRPSSLKLSNVQTTYGRRQLQSLRARLRSQTMRINELEERSYSLEVVLQAALHHLDCKFIISHGDVPQTLH